MTEQIPKPNYVVFWSKGDLNAKPVGFGYEPEKDGKVTIVIDQMVGDGKLSCIPVEDIRKPSGRT